MDPSRVIAAAKKVSEWFSYTHFHPKALVELREALAEYEAQKPSSVPPRVAAEWDNEEDAIYGN